MECRSDICYMMLLDGPMCLHDMLEFPKVLEPWKHYIPNYPLNLVYSGNVNPGNFRTGLQEVFELLRVAKDKNAMEEFLKIVSASEHI